MAVYGWDRDKIYEMASSLQEEAENILKQKEKLLSCRKRVEASYQGAAAEEFLKNLDADIIEAGQLYADMRIQVELLKRISNEVYGPCEEQLAQKVRQLQELIR